MPLHPTNILSDVQLPLKLGRLDRIFAKIAAIFAKLIA